MGTEQHIEEAYAELGALLRQARDELRISRAQASKSLNIRMAYLEALEEGKFSALPGAAYVRGYLQSYAGLLHLDREEILRRFQQIHQQQNRQTFYLPKSFHDEKNPNMYAIIGGMMVILAVYSVWDMLEKPKLVPLNSPFVAASAPQPAAKSRKSNDGTCLSGNNLLYPPCTAREAHSSEFPRRKGQIKTVMELAKPF